MLTVLVIYLLVGSSLASCACCVISVTGQMSDIWVSWHSRIVGLVMVWALVTLLWLPALLIAGAIAVYDRWPDSC